MCWRQSDTVTGQRCPGGCELITLAARSSTSTGAGRLAARTGLARCAQRAHGDAMERHPVRDELLARALHPPQVYQQVMSGKPRFSGAQAALEYFDIPDAATRSRAYGDRKQSMVIELCERLRLAQLQLRGGADLAGRHREPSLGRVTRWPRRAGRRPGDDGRHVRHGEGRPERAGLLGEGMEFEEAWEQLGHITMEGAEAIKQIGGALPKRTERGLLGPRRAPIASPLVRGRRARASR